MQVKIINLKLDEVIDKVSADFFMNHFCNEKDDIDLSIAAFNKDSDVRRIDLYAELDL